MASGAPGPFFRGRWDCAGRGAATGRGRTATASRLGIATLDCCACAANSFSRRCDTSRHVCGRASRSLCNSSPTKSETSPGTDGRRRTTGVSGSCTCRRITSCESSPGKGGAPVSMW
ncbi:MAG: hypothetical protein BWZ02_01797 [Lentisphaerae bacterium ADurb.BinA184]|nr:MAG: hypothetical protein BWZ02_01797 [Lentisphaerae bacterium ADurb.BinA184]